MHGWTDENILIMKICLYDKSPLFHVLQEKKLEKIQGNGLKKGYFFHRKLRMSFN